MKQFFFSCFLLLIPALFYAQSTWYMDLPGTDFGNKSVATYDGGIVMTTMLEHKIMKLDQSGTVLWTFVIDTSALVFLRSVTETEDHGIVAVGSHSGYTATLVWKLDENGNLLWQKRFDHPGNSLTVQWVTPAHGDGGFLIGGGECAMQFYVIRCNSSGNILWQNQYVNLTSAPTGYFPTLVQAPGSGYVATISRLESGDFDWGMLKIDDNGGILWAKATDEGPERDEVIAAVMTQAGGMAVLGTTTNYQAPNNEYKMTLTVFDNAGTRLSYRVYDYTEQLQPKDLMQTSDGGFILTGSTMSLNTLIVKTDGQGAIQWQKVGTGNVTQEGTGVEPAPGNMFYLSAHDFNHKATVAMLSALTGQGVCSEGTIQLSTSSHQPPVITLTPGIAPAGATETTINFPYRTENIQGSLVCSVVANDAPVNALALSCSPNPFTEMLHVDLGMPISQAGTLVLYDLQGRQVASQAVAAATRTVDWDVRGLAAGLLLLKFEAEGLSQTLRVVKSGE